MRITKGLKQAYDMQDFAFDSAMSLRQSLEKNGRIEVTREDAQAIAMLVRAWEQAQDRVRIHRNKPLPGSMRPEPKRKAVATTPITNIEPMSWAEPSPDAAQS